MMAGYHRATDNMADNPSEVGDDMWASVQERFAASVTLPPDDFPPDKILLISAVRGFVAERSGQSVARLKPPEIERLALPIKDALLDERIRAVCVTRDGPYLDVDPVAFRDRQTWRATFEKGVELPMRPRVGVEPGYLIVDRLAFERFQTGFRAEKALDANGTAYTPLIIKIVIQAVHRLGIEGGRYEGEDLPAVLRNLFEKDKLILGSRALKYLARFMIDPRHYRNGWTSQTPPVFEFLLNLVTQYGICEERRFSRVDFESVILYHAAERPDLGILPTHATYLSTFCGNPEHSTGGQFPSKPGAIEAKLSKFPPPKRVSAKKTTSDR